MALPNCQRGSLTFYALRDYIGEDAMHSALRAFLAKWALKGPPYPTERDIHAELDKATPDSLKRTPACRGFAAAGHRTENGLGM